MAPMGSLQERTAAALSVLFGEVLSGGLTPQLALRDALASDPSSSPTHATLAAVLAGGEPLSFRNSDGFLHLLLDGDVLIVRAGTRITQPFSRFILEFRRENELLNSEISQEGAIRLDVGSLQTLLLAADEVRILA